MGGTETQRKKGIEMGNGEVAYEKGVIANDSPASRIEKMPLRSVALVLMTLIALTGCRSKKKDDERAHGTTLRDYAAQARTRGSSEAVVPYGFDEEEGTNLLLPTLDVALTDYEWWVGEPIEEKAVPLSGREIWTIYRFRVEHRAGNPQQRHPEDQWVKEIRTTMPLRDGEILVVKSGGNIVVDGVLLKKRGELCFSELMPRRYLLGMRISSSGQVASLPMGCESIFMVDDDGRLTPRQTEDSPFIHGVREQLGNSLSAFLAAVEKHQK
jgi:hypothetical protein